MDLAARRAACKPFLDQLDELWTQYAIYKHISYATYCDRKAEIQAALDKI